MKKIRTISIIIFCGLLVIGIAGFFVYKEKNKFSNMKQSVELLPVTVSTISRQDFSETLNFHGTLSAKSHVYVIPKVPGRVEQVLAKVGNKVNKGDLLIQLETDELKLHKKQAEAGVAVAEAGLKKALTGARPAEVEQALANLEQARASYDNALLTLERSKKLYEEGVMSKQDWDGVNTQYTMAQAQLNMIKQTVELVQQGAREEDIATAEASVIQAKAAYDLACLSLDNASIRAPISGVISQVLTETGSLVGSTSPIISVVDSSIVKLTIMASENEVVKITPGQTVNIKLNALPNLKVEGVVTTVSPMGDVVGGLFPITIEIPNEDALLKPGMYSTASIEVAREVQGLAVPNMAIVQSDSIPKVFVVDQGIAKLVEVELGIRNENYAQVISGLNEGDSLVVTGQSKLIPGTEVKVMRTEESF